MIVDKTLPWDGLGRACVCVCECVCVVSDLLCTTLASLPTHDVFPRTAVWAHTLIQKPLLQFGRARHAQSKMPIKNIKIYLSRLDCFSVCENSIYVSFFEDHALNQHQDLTFRPKNPSIRSHGDPTRPLTQVTSLVFVAPIWAEIQK